MRRIGGLAIAAWLGLAAAFAGSAQEGGLGIEGGPWRPHRLCRATIAAPGGMEGELRVWAELWEGGRRLLFETDLAARTERIEAAFFLDGDAKSLLAEVGGGVLAASAPLETSASTDASASEDAGAPNEAAAAALIAGLSPPPSGPRRRTGLGAEPPERLALGGLGIDEAAARAASELFVRPAPAWPLAALVLSVLGVSLIAALAGPSSTRDTTDGRKPAAGAKPTAGGGHAMAKRPKTTGAEEVSRNRRPRRAAAALGILSLAASLLLILLAPREAFLFTVAFPEAAAGGAISGSLERSIEAGPGYRSYAYGGAGSGIVLFGARTARGTSLPLELVAGGEGLFRFSEPPLVRFEDGDYRFVARDLTIGWRVHEPR